MVNAVEELKRRRIKSLGDEEWLIEKGIVIKEEQVYVLEGELRGEVICLHHDTPVGEHGKR